MRDKISINATEGSQVSTSSHSPNIMGNKNKISDKNGLTIVRQITPFWNGVISGVLASIFAYYLIQLVNHIYKILR